MMIKEPIIEDLTNAISVTLHENFRIELDNEVLKAVQKCDIDVDKRKLTELLQIADRIEQADVEEAKNIYCQELSCAGLCDECDHLEDFADGYKQALADIRGNTE